MSSNTIDETFDAVIDGGSIPAESGERFDSINPATGKRLARVARGAAADVDQAVAAASDALPEWRSMPPQAKGRLLRKLADRIRAEQGRLAELETLDNGKPLSHARADVETCARYFEYYAGIADKLHGDSIPLTDDYVDFTVREPLGVTAQIIPWNLPTNIFGRSVAPALATGNVAVVKPAEQTSITAIEIGALAAEVGFPPGVLNIVPGFGAEAGARVAGHPDIDGISFTGSVPTGIEVAQNAIDNVTNVHLELGGKSPNVVYKDADIDVAVRSTAKGIFANAGQVCSAGSRLLVDQDIEAEFLDRFAEHVETISVGPGMGDSDMGPLVSEEHLQKVTDYIELGREEVGEPVIGGEVIAAEGYFVEPTVFAGADSKSRIAQEEIFGPVLVVQTFETEREAIQLANDTEYGLVAGVHTKDIGKAHRFAQKVAAGQVYVNEWFAGGEETPFGGVKKSGFGREKGLAAVDAYTQLKNVCVNIVR